MKKYTLDKFVRKLIKRDYLTVKTQFKLQIDENPEGPSETVTRSELNNTPALLAPVQEVFIKYDWDPQRHILAKIDEGGILFLIARDEIIKKYKEAYGDNGKKDVDAHYEISIVCKALPYIYLDSFIYQEDYIRFENFESLLTYHNTCMGSVNYNNALKYIEEHRRELARKYSGKEDGVLMHESMNAHKILEIIVSKLCGFKVGITADTYSKAQTIYVIKMVVTDAPNLC